MANKKTEVPAKATDTITISKTITSDIFEKVQRAFALHKLNQLDDALKIYKEILLVDEFHFDALHLSGVIHYQNKRYDEAIELIARAIKQNPNNAAAYNNIGVAYKEKGNLIIAIENFEKAVELDDNYIEAINNLANALRDAQQIEEAIVYFKKAIEKKPDNAEAYNSLGILQNQHRKIEDAEITLKKAIEIKPNYLEALINLGNVQRALQKHEEALESFSKVISINPKIAEAYNNRGIIYHDKKQYELALNDYNKALEINPKYVQSYNNRGFVYHDLKQHDLAIASYEEAIKIMPNYAEPHNNKGVSLSELKKYDSALESYSEAIRLKPDYAEAHNNKGVLLHDLRQLNAAIECYDNAILHKSDYAEPHNNRGVALGDIQNYHEAIVSYQNAINIRPDYSEAHSNISLLYLLLGNYEKGFEEYEWRWKNSKLGLNKPIFKQPAWTGIEPLEGKTILIYSEQGYGDSIQFCRYIAFLKERGAKTVLGIEKPLHRLFKSLKSVDQFVLNGETLPSFDYHIPMLSLPLAFKTRVETIPFKNKYLSIDKEKLQEWKERLGKKTKPRIGIVWSGSTIHRNDQNRSLTLQEFISYLPSEYEYISLQKEIRDLDLKLLMKHENIKHYENFIEDFLDTGAICEQLDLVISVDTSVAHLAAALGRPTWILVPYNQDWRWLLDRSDTPWYPSMKLYRKTDRKDWTSALQNMSADIKKFFK